jgi:hypothetical protein
MVPSYPTCAASIPSAATIIPCACSCRTGRPPQPCRIAQSRTLRSKPMCHTPGLEMPPRASSVSCTRRWASRPWLESGLLPLAVTGRIGGARCDDKGRLEKLAHPRRPL